MPTPKYYLLDDNKNKIEVENIENNLFRTILAKIHSDLNNTDYAIEFVTEAQFNQLKNDDELVGNTYYYITDDITEEGLEQRINENAQEIEDTNGRIDELEERISDFKWKRKASGVSTFDLEFGKQYFIVVKNGGYAYPEDHSESKYYGSFTIEQRSVYKSYHLQGSLTQSLQMGNEYILFIAGSRIYIDDTTTDQVVGVQNADENITLELDCSTTMDVYELI